MDETLGYRQSLDDPIDRAETIADLVKLLRETGEGTPIFRTALFTRAQQIRRQLAERRPAPRNWTGEILVATWQELLIIEEEIAFVGPMDPIDLAPLAALVERRAQDLAPPQHRSVKDTLQIEMD